MSQALLIDILRSIKRSVSRFISLIIIIALGAGFFVGMNSTGPSMKKTAKEYFSGNNLMDLRVQSSIGITDDDIKALSSVDGVEYVQGEKFVDALVWVNGSPEIDIDGSQISVRAFGLDVNKFVSFMNGSNDSSFINRPTLIEGTYPRSANECLVDASKLSTPASYKIGNKIKLKVDSGVNLDSVKETEFKIVGIVRSPYYVSYERGNSLVGSGKIGTYIYIPNEAFSSDYYSEAYITLKDSSKNELYSDEYEKYVDGIKNEIEIKLDDSVRARSDRLKINLPIQITAAQKIYDKAEEKIKASLSAAKEKLDEYQKIVDDPEGAYNEAAAEVAKSLGLAENTFTASNSDYQKAITEYNTNLSNYQNANAALENSKEELDSAKETYDKIKSAIDSLNQAIDTNTNLVDQTNSIVEQTQQILDELSAYQQGKITDEQLKQAMTSLRAINPELYDSIASMSAVSLAMEAVNIVTPYLDQEKSLLANYKATLDKQKDKLNEYSSQLNIAKSALDAKENEYQNAKAALQTAYNQLSKYYDTLSGTKDALTMGQVELMLKEQEASQKLQQLQEELNNAPAELEKAKSEYNSSKQDAEDQLNQIKSKIDQAKNTLENLDNLTMHVYTREDTPGFTSYKDAITTVDNLSIIFPAIFFLVAILVCFMTMTRMAEEERTQMGTLKGLGYSDNTIMSKYILYGVFASLIGSGLGIISGMFGIPFAINKAYSIMFSMPSLKFDFPVRYILAGIVISVGTSILASALVSGRQLKEKTAELMRPKAPKPGKRVLLEKIPSIWNKLSFTGKVTIRNLFRRKGKMVMTIIGIAGCCALILASIGLYSSVNGVMEKQYGSNGISEYDALIAFRSSQNSDSELIENLKSDTRITDLMRTSMMSVSGGKDENSKLEDIYLLVPENNNLSKYIKLIDADTGANVGLNDGGALITDKFAKEFDLKKGDNIYLLSSDDKSVSIPISGIVENYTFNYVYLTENTYQYYYQKAASYDFAMVNIQDAVLNNTSDDNARKTFTDNMMSTSGINAVSYTSDTVNTLNNVINVLSYVIAIFIISAASLAFIVLYNLNNTNITERTREIATIKVLGFKKKEIHSYVYRENIFLTIIGIIVGIIAGIFLHLTVINALDISTVNFLENLTWYDYVIAVVSTSVFSWASNQIMKGKINKIDMATSLKSVE